MPINIILFDLQLIADKLKNGSDNITFLERLLRVSDENESFSHEDVRAEATNTLTAVYVLDVTLFSKDSFKSNCF